MTSQREALREVSDVEAREDARRETLLAADRIKTRAQFRAIQSSGRKFHAPHFVFAVVQRDEPLDGPARLGITVTRKVANAVGRNRIKRVMREVFRRNRELFPLRCDVVAIAKQGADSLAYRDVLDEVRGLAAGLARRGGPRRGAVIRGEGRG